jgi:hypothetical protein
LAWNAKELFEDAAPSGATHQTSRSRGGTIRATHQTSRSRGATLHKLGQRNHLKQDATLSWTK